MSKKCPIQLGTQRMREAARSGMRDINGVLKSDKLNATQRKEALQIAVRMCVASAYDAGVQDVKERVLHKYGMQL